MKAIIMAAGRGTRFGDLTKNTPKPLLEIKNKPIMEYVLESLPSEIDEAIVVIKYLGGQIKDYFGNSFGAVKIKYIEQGELGGTAGAVWSARPFLKQDTFLIVSGDDLYARGDLELLVKYDLAIALHSAEADAGNFYGVQLDAQGNLHGFEKEATNKKLVATGAYMLDQRIFNYEPVQIKNGEYGLPQTILKLAMDYPIKGVMMKNWQPGNTADDLRKMEELLKLNK